ncbi:mitochondrial deoxyuridine 5'-triphosphate nucleotidohydrolase, partial [Dimargaris cristalligena]
MPPPPIAAPLLVVRKHAHAQLPKRGSAGAAGYDLYSCEDAVIPPQSRGLVDTGLSIKVPSGTYGRVAPRSGLAVKHFIDTGAGVVDEDYRGIVKVVLFNFGDKPFAIKIGDRIAQLVLERIVTPAVAEVADLDDTDRGEGGFGSTG